jgi:hypothetical protein
MQAADFQSQKIRTEVLSGSVLTTKKMQRIPETVFLEGVEFYLRV